MPKISTLRGFCTVVEQESFSRASEVLGITQSAVSQQIKALEKEYGSLLLHRDGPSIVPTEAGLAVYEHALQIVRLYEGSKQRLLELEDLLAGELVVGAGTGLGEYLLPRAMVAFHEAFPHAAVQLHVGDSSEILSRVLRHQTDLGFVGTSQRDRHIHSEPLITDRLVLVVAPEHEYAHRPSLDWGSFKQMPLVLQQEGSGATRALREALRPMGIRLEDLHVNLQAGLQESTKCVVRTGCGGTIISRFGVIEELRAGSLVEVPVDGLELRHEFFTVYRRSWPLSRLAQAFLEKVQHSAKRTCDEIEAVS